MTPELLRILLAIVGGTCFVLSYRAGWRARGAQRPPRGSYGRCLDPDWRRSFNHENTNHPTGELPLRLRRSGNDQLGPTTPKPDIIPKPQFPPPRTIQGNQP